MSDIYILTAAHCVVDMKIQRLWASIGDHDTRILDKNEKIIQADKIIIHIRYNPKNFQNDIGMKRDCRFISDYEMYFLQR